MPRAIWNGTISFGLVQIPVGLYSAESPDELHFRMLDRRNMAPVRFERVNSESGEPVPYQEVVKGYEASKGEFIVLDKQDFENANVEATQTVDIVQFVDAAEIPPYFYERPYYLAPTKKGAKAYALLREVLRKSGKVGIAKVVIRTRQHIAALIVEDDVLILNMLRYGHELRDWKELDLPSKSLTTAGITAKEMEMAQMLVEGMIGEFDPTAFQDTYRDDLLELIERKRETGESQVIHPEEADRRDVRRAKVIDIMDLLQKSLEKAPEAPKKTTAARPARAKRPAKRKSARKAATRKKKASGSRS